MTIEAFSYEDIYELLRTEKFSADLENITPKDLLKIHAYLKSKKELLEKEGDSINLLSSQKKAKIQIEIDNAIRALKDLYEIRERKIINRALISIRTNSGIKDTTNMLNTEVELYEQLLNILEKNKKKFFNLIEKADEKEIIDNNEFKEKTADEEEDKREYKLEEKRIHLYEVEFLDDCPEVFGEDLQQYGPFKVGDKAKLPEQLCSILEKQKKVRLIKTHKQ